MKDHSRISQIDYLKSDWLNRLTFVFADGIRAPPKGTYRNEPTSTRILKEFQITGLVFGIFKVDDIHSVSNLASL